MSVVIDIRGPQGNAYAIMGHVADRLHALGCSGDSVEIVMQDMMSGDYDHLLDVAEEYIGIIGRD